MATKVHAILQSFVVLTWMHDNIELVLHVTLEITQRRYEGNLNSFSPHHPVGGVHSTWPSGRCDKQMHQHSTSGIRRKTKKVVKVTLHMLTHGAMRGCGLTSSMVCLNDMFRDIKREICQ